jgi:lipopolysaccharide transport system permease protein
MQLFSASPVEMVMSSWRNRALIVALARRDVVGRYRGSMLGLFWSLIHPVFMLGIYTFVFSVVFKARWGGGEESRGEFALVLFTGLLVFNVFAECISQAPDVIVSNANYVKKVVFPLEILPVVSLMAALFHCGVSFGVWLLARWLLVGIPPVTALLFPVTLLPLILIVMGLSWILASLGVYLRDLAQFIRLLTSVLLFLSPIFYPATALPEEYRPILFLNPLTITIEHVRAVLYWGKGFDPFGYFALLAAGFVVAMLGFAWFQKTRKGFADVL